MKFQHIVNQPLIFAVLFFVCTLPVVNYASEDSMSVNTKIYQVNKKFTFKSTFYTAENTVEETEKVALIIVGGTKEGTLDQFKGRWEYQAYPELNKNWTIGITENDNRVFIHQPRHGKYLFTEVCDFPSVRLPLSAGMVVKGRLRIPKNSKAYGAFQGWKVKTKTTVVGKDTVNIPLQKQLPVWKTTSLSKHKKGKNHSTFYYNEQYGFVKLVFEHYDNSSLVMELISVEDIQP